MRPSLWSDLCVKSFSANNKEVTLCTLPNALSLFSFGTALTVCNAGYCYTVLGDAQDATGC